MLASLSSAKVNKPKANRNLAKGEDLHEKNSVFLVQCSYTCARKTSVGYETEVS
jgi:hypothetical protein